MDNVPPWVDIMKIMFLMWEFEMKNVIGDWIPYFSQLPFQFVLCPLIRGKDVAEYGKLLHDLRKQRQVAILPIVVESQDIRFRSILNLTAMLKDLLIFFKTFTQSRPDVVVCLYVRHAYLLVILRRIFGFSLVPYALGDDVNLDMGVLDKIARRIVYKNSNMIFAVSEELKGKITATLDRDVKVVPIGTDTSFFKPLEERQNLRRKWMIASGDFVILTVCRLDRRKGVHLLIDAMASLKQRDLKLIIAGTGGEIASLKSLAGRRDVLHRTSFLGFRTREELAELYNVADVFVLASSSEGLPRALIEAMSCGCVCIATNVGDIPQLITDGYNGFLIPPNDAGRLSEAVDHVISLPIEETKLLQSRARLLVSERFDNRKLVATMINSLGTGSE
jgi:glycosyltransferase involved in cell wall biosynthesis